MDEVFKDIVGYEGLYKVSSIGRVVSLKFGKMKELKPCVNGNGYFQVILCKNGVKKTKSVHRLVATAFIQNPENKPCIDHINTNKLDDRVENLHWVTQKENSNNVLTKKHMSEVAGFGKENKFSVKVVQLTKDGSYVKTWNSMHDADIEGFNNSSISKCCQGKRKSAYGFKWIYFDDYEEQAG